MSADFSRRAALVPCAGILIALFSMAAGTQASDYPSRPITLIVPFAAGGPLDVLSRTIAESMSRQLGQPIIVENLTGAGGSVGSAKAVRAEPSGYVLLAGHAGTLAANVGLYPRLPYDPINDLEPIGFMGDVPQVIVTRKSFPVKEPGRFLYYVKENADKVTMGHAGVGSASHLAGLLFQQAIGKSIQSVAYRGSGPAMIDLMGGQFDFMIDLTTNAVSQIESGTIQPIAVLRDQRIAILPNVMTTAEIGLPRVKAAIWNALVAPKGTPQFVILKLNGALRTAFSDPSVVAKLDKLGVDPPPADLLTPEGARAMIKDEVERWLPIIKGSGASLQP
jgi:tripartite-type tricarboxylate transporter receptor subunit TctC